MKEKNLCDTCKYDFATCDREEIIWGIDKNPKAKGAEADAVLECKDYSKQLEERQMINIKEISKFKLEKDEYLFIQVPDSISAFDIERFKFILRDIGILKVMFYNDSIKLSKVKIKKGLNKVPDWDASIKFNEGKKYHHSKFYCSIMNLIDFRYWRCECHYKYPYGRVISADCEKHD